MTAAAQERARAIVESIAFGRRQRRILSHLVDRFGRWTTTEDLIVAVWGEREAAWPRTVRQSLGTQIGIIRCRIKDHGLAIEWHGGGERRLVFSDGAGP